MQSIVICTPTYNWLLILALELSEESSVTLN
jgi:hypothetical protein